MSSPENRFQKIQKEEKEGEGCASEHSRSDVRLVWFGVVLPNHVNASRRFVPGSDERVSSIPHIPIFSGWCR